MNLRAAILERLPATPEDLADELGRGPSMMRNTLAGMYFAGQVGCDAMGRYHPPGASSNGVPVVRYAGGRDVVA